MNGSAAPNAPIQIVTVDKEAEVVTIANTTGAPMDVTGWTICSLLGSQRHAVLVGTLDGHATRVVPSEARRAIWNNREQESAAVYNAACELVASWSEAK